MRRAIPHIAILLATLPLAGPAVAQEGYPEITREQELRLAMSAGPLTVSANADLWVLGPSGFERVVAGTNGFACLVLRAAGARSVLAPHCLNPAAVETVLPAMLREAELQVRGLEAGAIEAEMARQWEAGELPLPSGPAYAYMLSEGQHLGDRVGNFRPHFMLYVPYLTNQDVGGDPQRIEFPFVGPREGHPLSTLVILMEEFVSPADVVLPRR